MTIDKVPSSLFGFTGTANSTTFARGDGAWGVVPIPTNMPSSKSIKNANYTITTADLGSEIASNGAITFTLPVANSVANGSYIVFRNTALNTTTYVANIAPSAGTIDGHSFINVYPGEFFVITTPDGVEWETVGRKRGWVPILVSNTTAAVGSVGYSTGFSDPEITHIRISGSITVSGNLDLRVAKGGSTQTTGYGNAQCQAVGQAGVFTAAGSTSFPISVSGTIGAKCIDISLLNFASTNPVLQSVISSCVGTTGTAWYTEIGGGYNSVAGAITGVNISAGVNMTPVCLTLSGYRA